MPAAAILDAAETKLAGDLIADGVAVEELRLAIAHLAFVAGDLVFHPADVTGFGGQQHVAVAQIALDPVLGDALPDDGARLFREIEQRPSALLAEPGDQL